MGTRKGKTFFFGKPEKLENFYFLVIWWGKTSKSKNFLGPKYSSRSLQDAVEKFHAALEEGDESEVWSEWLRPMIASRNYAKVSLDFQPPLKQWVLI